MTTQKTEVSAYKLANNNVLAQAEAMLSALEEFNELVKGLPAGSSTAHTASMTQIHTNLSILIQAGKGGSINAPELIEESKQATQVLQAMLADSSLKIERMSKDFKDKQANLEKSLNDANNAAKLFNNQHHIQALLQLEALLGKKSRLIEKDINGNNTLTNLDPNKLKEIKKSLLEEVSNKVKIKNGMDEKTQKAYIQLEASDTKPESAAMLVNKLVLEGHKEITITDGTAGQRKAAAITALQNNAILNFTQSGLSLSTGANDSYNKIFKVRQQLSKSTQGQENDFKDLFSAINNAGIQQDQANNPELDYALNKELADSTIRKKTLQNLLELMQPNQVKALFTDLNEPEDLNTLVELMNEKQLAKLDSSAIAAHVNNDNLSDAALAKIIDTHPDALNIYLQLDSKTQARLPFPQLKDNKDIALLKTTFEDKKTSEAAKINILSVIDFKQRLTFIDKIQIMGMPLAIDQKLEYLLKANLQAAKKEDNSVLSWFRPSPAKKFSAEIEKLANHYDSDAFLSALDTIEKRALPSTGVSQPLTINPLIRSARDVINAIKSKKSNTDKESVELDTKFTP